MTKERAAMTLTIIELIRTGIKLDIPLERILETLEKVARETK